MTSWAALRGMNAIGTSTTTAYTPIGTCPPTRTVVTDAAPTQFKTINFCLSTFVIPA